MNLMFIDTRNTLIGHILGGKFLEYFPKKLTFSEGLVKTIDGGENLLYTWSTSTIK